MRQRLGHGGLRNSDQIQSLGCGRQPGRPSCTKQDVGVDTLDICISTGMGANEWSGSTGCDVTARAERR